MFKKSIRWIYFLNLLMALIAGNSMAENQNQAFHSYFDFQWSNGGEVCFVKPAINKYELYNPTGDLLWSKTMSASNVVLSPDGAQLAYVIPENGLHVVTIQGNTDSNIFTTQNGKTTICKLAWAPGGSQLTFWAFSTDGNNQSKAQLIFINADGSEMKEVRSIKLEPFLLSKQLESVIPAIGVEEIQNPYHGQ